LRFGRVDPGGLIVVVVGENAGGKQRARLEEFDRLADESAGGREDAEAPITGSPSPTMHNNHGV
jgi:hypothetical protein